MRYLMNTSTCVALSSFQWV